MNGKHIMVDLETLSTKSNAVILTIGAIKFDPTVESLEGDLFYRKIDLNSYNNVNGFDLDLNTLCWWHKQVQQAREEAFLGDNRIPLTRALNEFKDWIGTNSYLWANGSIFDIPILCNAYNVLGMEEPWEYWNVRDTRTIYSLAKVDLKSCPLPENMVAHNAIADCYRQVIALKLAFKKLGFSKSNN